MSAIIVFLTAIAGIIAWWMAHQRLTSKPWLETGRSADLPATQGAPLPAEKIGLGIFLAVVGALFALLISAYLTRVEDPGWWGIPIPRQLFVNTAVLAAGSAALQWARTAGFHASRNRLHAMLAVAFVAGVLFVVGQLLAWHELLSAGYLIAGNPANSFFYMITGLHGLHVLGGLLVLGRTTLRVRSASVSARTRLSIDLCAVYWHAMLVIWLIVFALFAGWANSFADLCLQLVR